MLKKARYVVNHGKCQNSQQLEFRVVHTGRRSGAGFLPLHGNRNGVVPVERNQHRNINGHRVSHQGKRPDVVLDLERYGTDARYNPFGLGKIGECVDEETYDEQNRIPDSERLEQEHGCCLRFVFPQDEEGGDVSRQSQNAENSNENATDADSEIVTRLL